MDKVWLIIYLLISFCIKITPKKLLKIFANLLANFVCFYTPKVRKTIIKNLSHFTALMDEKQAFAASKEVYKNFVYYVFLMVKNQNVSKEKILEQISEFQDCEEFENLLKSGEKIVFTTAHFCNWELLPNAVALRFGCALSIVAKALRHESINKRLIAARAAYGVEIIEKTGAVKGMLKAAKNGRAIGLVSDQDAHINESCEFEINGFRATQSKSAALIAQKIDAYLVPIFVVPDGEKFRIIFMPSMRAKAHTIEELSEYQLRCTEQMWRLFPTQYFWFHKRFKTFYEAEY